MTLVHGATLFFVFAVFPPSSITLHRSSSACQKQEWWTKPALQPVLGTESIAEIGPTHLPTDLSLPRSATYKQGF